MAGKFLSLSCWYVLFTVNLAEQRYVCEPGRDGVMFMCDHVYDVAFCGNTIKKCGSWSMTGATPGMQYIHCPCDFF